VFLSLSLDQAKPSTAAPRHYPARRPASTAAGVVTTQDEGGRDHAGLFKLFMIDCDPNEKVIMARMRGANRHRFPVGRAA
jgi:hypothetical protein